MEKYRLMAAWFGLFFLFGSSTGMSHGAEICGYPQAAVVEIVRGDTVVGEFAVAVAATEEVQRRGLMHCLSLAPATGMLFTYPNADRRVFWMKNTWIELAIIFIASDGRISAIAHGQPGNEAHIRSPEAIQSVLEINVLESRTLMTGDRVRVKPSTR